MHVIKGLMVKDILQVKSYSKTLIVFLLIFSLVSFQQKENFEGLLIIMITTGLGMFSMATFNYDESTKTDRYLLTLPLSKKDIVLSKYILVSTATILGSLLGLLLAYGIAFLLQQPLKTFEELLSYSLGSIIGIGLIQAIQIPCIYKFGVEIGRMMIFIISAFLALIIGSITLIISQYHIAIPLETINNLFNQYYLLFFLLAIFLIYFISYQLALKIYQKKEL